MLRRLLPFFAALTAAARPPVAEDFGLHPACRIELWAAEPDIVLGDNSRLQTGEHEF